MCCLWEVILETPGSNGSYFTNKAPRGPGSMKHRRSFEIRHVSWSHGPHKMSSWSPNTELSCKVSLLYWTLLTHWLNVLLSSFGAMFHYRVGKMLDAFVIWVCVKVCNLTPLCQRRELLESWIELSVWCFSLISASKLWHAGICPRMSTIVFPSCPNPARALFFG